MGVECINLDCVWACAFYMSLLSKLNFQNDDPWVLGPDKHIAQYAPPISPDLHLDSFNYA